MTEKLTRFLRVFAGGRSHAIALSAVREVVAMCAVVPVDRAEGSLRGVVNLRGEVVTLVDLSGPGVPLRPNRFFLLCDLDDGPVGLVVDDVLDLVDVPRASIAQGTTQRPGFVRVGSDLVPVIEPTRVGVGVPGDPCKVDLNPREKRLLEQRARRYASADERDLGDAAEYVIFERGSHRFGVPLRDLREIRVLDRPSIVVGASAVVPGVFNYRGMILSLHDIDAFVHGADRAPARWVIVAEHDGQRLGLVADDVLDIQIVNASRVRTPPSTRAGRTTVVEGLLDDDLMLLRTPGLFAEPAFFLAA